MTSHSLRQVPANDHCNDDGCKPLGAPSDQSAAPTSPDHGRAARTEPSQSRLLLLLEQIREDYVAHGKDWSKPGFQAVAVHRFGSWRLGVRTKIARAPLTMLYRSLFRLVRNVYGIEIPDTVRLGRRVVVEHQGDVVVHGHAALGDDCIIRQGVTIGNRHLNRPLDAPVLGDGVNVGSGAKILGKLYVGDHASVGANAVVTHDVAANDTVVGIPARSVKRAG